MKKISDHLKPVTGDLLDNVPDQTVRSKLERLQKTMQDPKYKRQQAEQEQIDQAPAKAVIVQLPFWPEPARGVPNSALRGALFAAIQGKNRQYMKRELLAVQKDIEIRFTGMQLDQSDLDVWEQCLHFARMHPLGTRCEFTAHGFLKALGRATGKKNHEWLKDVLARLMGCGVEITHNRMTYGGSLLEFYRDEETQCYRLEINPKLITLYSAGWTACDWEQRKQLGRKPLALWLHGWLSSHAVPYPIKLETLQQWSGSRNRQPADFKRKLKAALDDLKGIKAIIGYKITGDLVTIDREPSKSQGKHLRKPKPRRK